MDVEKLEANIGKKCRKRPLDDKNIGKYKLKPFKSGLKVNTIKGVIKHPNLEGQMAYTFEEDESYVDCRRCHVIKPKFSIKSKEEVNELKPERPKGFGWKAFLSNFMYYSLIGSFALGLSIALWIFSAPLFAINTFLLYISIVTIASLIMIGNNDPIFTDKIFEIHYYKKRVKVWNRWWYQTARHLSYLEYKEQLESHER